MAGQVLRRGVEGEDLVEESVVGQDLGQALLDAGEVDADPGRVELAGLDLDLDPEGVAVDLLAFALVFAEEMGGRELVLDAELPALSFPSFLRRSRSGSSRPASRQARARRWQAGQRKQGTSPPA